MQNHSYGYKFYLQVKENSFSYEWFCTWPLSEKEAKSNSEMGYWVGNGLLDRYNRTRNESTIKTIVCFIHYRQLF